MEVWCEGKLGLGKPPPLKTVCLGRAGETLTSVLDLSSPLLRDFLTVICKVRYNITCGPSTEFTSPHILPRIIFSE